MLGSSFCWRRAKREVGYFAFCSRQSYAASGERSAHVGALDGRGLSLRRAPENVECLVHRSSMIDIECRGEGHLI